MQLYVRGKSKAEINRKLDAGLSVLGIEHIMGITREVMSNEWPHGAVIKVYSKCIGGSPYARSYGTVRRSGSTVKVA